MRIEQQPAWVLHLRAWRETSALVELFTRDHGRIGAVVRGIRGPRQQTLRAALQPLVPLQVDLMARGELAQLRQAEATGPAIALRGDALMAGFYVNELVLRLAPRNDPATDVFEAYGSLLGQLRDSVTPGGLAWALRGFERDLLQAHGVGFDLLHDADGRPIDAAARYRVESETGAVRDPMHRPGSVSGASLLALAGDQAPDSEILRELKRMLREQISTLLGGRPLHSWDLLARMPGHRGGSVAREE